MKRVAALFLAPFLCAASAQAQTPDADQATIGVCDPRITTLHFGARGARLSDQNRDALEHAVDAASVCRLDQIIIYPSGDTALAIRRAEAARAVLVGRGVPNDLIALSAEPAEGAETGQVQVRMNFAGFAQAGDVLAPPETASPQQAPSNEAEPAPGS